MPIAFIQAGALRLIHYTNRQLASSTGIENRPDPTFYTIQTRYRLIT